jgi:hypothetical protein
MAANRLLAGIRGLTIEEVSEIDRIHLVLEDLIKEAVTEDRPVLVVLDEIARLEYMLQGFWGFPKDPSKHTWGTRYLFKKEWAFTTWECEETGTVVTIPHEVEERDLFSIGNGYLDVGRYGLYSRISGVRQVL